MSRPVDRRSTGIVQMQEIHGFTLEPDSVRGGLEERTTIGTLPAQGNVDLLDMPFDSAPVERP